MKWAAMIPIIEKGKDIAVEKHIVITHARSGSYCTIDVPVLYQPEQEWGQNTVSKAK
jgi:hypothetical protein